ncbi:MAG: thiamine biosynthesis protein ThiS [Rhodobacter sp.]|nr:thiamine biosynthesis protein ThiS [Rhodobacter sp.]
MRIDLNGTTFTVVAQSLAEMLIELGFDGGTIATAVNGIFVPAAARAGTRLHAGDRIEVLAPMQGG